MKKSLYFSRSLNRSIVFDFVLKGILTAVMLLLIWWFQSNLPLVISLCCLLIISIILIKKEAIIRAELRKIEDLSKELGTVLRRKIEFYKFRFPRLKWMLAFTNSMLVWIGSLIYYYSKYGYYKVEDAMDVLVSVVVITLAFAISYVALSVQYKLNFLELEEALDSLQNANQASRQIMLQDKRKFLFKVVLLASILIGTALLIYLVHLFLQ